MSSSLGSLWPSAGCRGSCTSVAIPSRFQSAVLLVVLLTLGHACVERYAQALLQQAVIKAGDGDANDYFGGAVSVSGDGTMAVIGASSKAINGRDNQGAAYIFTYTNGAWTQSARVTANDAAAGDYFGVSVAMASNASVVLVGANLKETGSKMYHGAAYIYTRSGTGTWPQTARLLPNDGETSGWFGYSVSLAANGDVALAGSVGKSVSMTTYAGAAYVFTRNSGGSWAQTFCLTASDCATGDWFGASVCL